MPTSSNEEVPLSRAETLTEKKITDLCSIKILSTKNLPQSSSLRSIESWETSLTNSFECLTVEESQTPRTPLEGIVVGKPSPKERIVQILTKGSKHRWMVLDSRSIDSLKGDRLPEIQQYILISRFITIGGRSLIEEYCNNQSKTSLKGEEEMFAVAEVSTVEKNIITVVGIRHPLPTPIYCDLEKNSVKAGDLMIGIVNPLLPRFYPVLLDGVLAYVTDNDPVEIVKSSETKTKSRKKKKLFEDSKSSYWVSSPGNLSDHGREMVQTNCRKLSSLSLKEATLYIRDPYIAIARLEKAEELKSVKRHTLRVPGKTFIDFKHGNGRVVLQVELDESETWNVVQKKSQETWRVGLEVAVKHKELATFVEGQKKRYKEEVGMIIDKIKFHDKGSTVWFRPHHRSRELFMIMRNSKEMFNGFFTVGPDGDQNETVTDVLTQKFESFFKKTELFNCWRGNVSSAIQNFVVPDPSNPFFVKKDPLDPYQTRALRTAMIRPGITPIEAPPGSGKTHLIAAIVAAKHEEESPGMICISATTNNAITNAVEKIYDCFDHIRLTREYSSRKDGNLSEKSKRISLLHMAINADKYLDLSKHRALGNTIERWTKTNKEIDACRRVQIGIGHVHKKRRLATRLRREFHLAYQPFVTGTTCEMLARRNNVKGKKARTEKEKAQVITHLILDEASQLSPHMALAVYCCLPNLIQISLIGDSKQLGPFTQLEEGTFAHKLVSCGELARIGKTVEPIRLQTVYRSHPRIVDLLLQPIYGNELKSGLEPKARNLVKEKELPCALDQSPVLFVNIDNASCDNRGVNKKELNVVLDFIETLKKKGITGEDVVVVCNHLAQREALLSALTGKGEMGPLNTTVEVHTVDSYQGKEAKVVLFLTTKTCPKPNMVRSVFQFVANPNRGCVGVSRGQHACYLFGEWMNLVQTAFWTKFAPGIVRAGALVDAQWNQATRGDYLTLLENSNL